MVRATNWRQTIILKVIKKRNNILCCSFFQGNLIKIIDHLLTLLWIFNLVSNNHLFDNRHTFPFCQAAPSQVLHCDLIFMQIVEYSDSESCWRRVEPRIIFSLHQSLFSVFVCQLLGRPNYHTEW
jgi:hypothetical protein